MKPASVVASERRKQSGPKSKEQSPPEVTVVIDDDDEEAEVVAAKPPPKNKRARGNSGENSGTGSSVTKGKARANGVVENEDVMEVDEVEVVENGVPEPPKGKRSGKTTKSPQTATVGRSAEEDALRIEVETLKAQLEEVSFVFTSFLLILYLTDSKVTAQKDKLANKLEELFHLRHTEPEAALESQAKQYEAHLEGEELTFSRMSPLTPY